VFPEAKQVLHTAHAGMQLLTLALLLIAAPLSGVASSQIQTFRARLSTVPIDVAMQSTIAGTGSVTATLSGTTLSIKGTFDGLKSPATTAKIHVGPKGIRGPAVLDLIVEKGTSGTLTGTLTLSAQQVDDLTHGRLYVQLHSEKAPDGNLWGWLLPPKARQ
jgi:hypothetical protein